MQYTNKKQQSKSYQFYNFTSQFYLVTKHYNQKVKIMSQALRSVKSSKSINSKSSKQLSLNQIQHPQKVRVLILSQQKLIFQEYYFLKNFSQIIKLDLSYNKISQFPQAFSFKNFPQLKTLFLHYNKFDKLKNLELLSESKLLVYFTLFGNPLQQTLARHFCINIMPWLKLMDDKPIKEQEKYSGILDLSSKILLNQRIGFPLIQFQEESDSIEFLGNVMREIKLARDIYRSVNPIVVIQKWWKALRKIKQQQKDQMLVQKEQEKLIYQNKILLANNQKGISTINQKRQFALHRNEKQQKMQDTHSNKDKILQNEIQSEIKQRDGQERELRKSLNLKILSIFQLFCTGLKSFKNLLNQENTILCNRQHCILNGYKYKQLEIFKGKYFKIYRTPQTNLTYSLQKQKSKPFLSLIFYNNFQYLVQLKAKRIQKFKTPKQKTQLISDKSYLTIIKEDSENSNDLVQITQQKIAIIKKQYLKAKSKVHMKPFSLLFGINVIKISSAVKIQKWWKGYKQRNKFNALKTIRQQFAAKKIQKWVRQIKFKHRQKFLVQSYAFLKNNQSANICIRLSTFCRLQQLYLESMIKPKLFQLPFQDILFQVIQKNSNQSLDGTGNDQDLALSSRNKVNAQIKINALRQPFPSYFLKYLQNYDFKQNINSDAGLNTIKSKILDLLIKGSKSIVKFSEIIDHKQKQKINFIRFQYFTKQDANKRKFLLCLFTYDFKSKKWADIYSIKQTNFRSNTIDVNQKIKQIHFLKMVYDNNKKERLFQKISKYTKEVQPKSQINWTPLKIRYFQGAIDFSSILIIGKYKQRPQSHENNQALNFESENNYESRKRLKQLNSLKSLQSKIALNNIDTQLIVPGSQKGTINRSIISLSAHIQKQMDQSIVSQNKRYYQYRNNRNHNLKSLQSDQSQFSLDWSQNSDILNSLHQYGSTVPVKNQAELSIDQNYLSQKKLESIFQKKAFIEKIKNTHKYKLEMLKEIRKRKNEELKSSHRASEQQNRKLIRQSSNTSLIQNINKVKRIKQYQKSRSSVKQDSQRFQNKFLRKGIISMKHQLKQFCRSKSKNQQYQLNQSVVKKSARYHQSLYEKDKINNNQGKIGINRKNYAQKAKRSALKTQLKQFSIQLSQGMDLNSNMFPEGEHHHDSSVDILLKEHKRSKQLHSNIKRMALNSATSQKISKLYEMKRKQALRSEQSEQMSSSQSNNELKLAIKAALQNEMGLNNIRNQSSPNNYNLTINTPTNMINKNQNQPNNNNISNISDISQQQTQLINNSRRLGLQTQKRKQLRKKKIVHSVFPQQFFPLKDSQQIGFHLPRISRNQQQQQQQEEQEE